MSSHFTYEIDERNLKQKLKDFELEYKPDAWLKFQNQGLSQIKIKEPNVFIKAKVHFNKRLLMVLIFLIIIISLSLVLFKIINIKNPINKNIISPRSNKTLNEENKKISPEIKPKILLNPLISKTKKDTIVKVSEKDTINQEDINNETRVIIKSVPNQSDKNLKIKNLDYDKRIKQNNLSEETLKIQNLPNIIPTLSNDSIKPELK